MSDGEIIAQLVDRYRRALVTRKNLDSIAENIIGMESDASMAATNAEASLKAMHIQSTDCRYGDGTRSTPKTASIIIKQQARRIDEIGESQ